MPLEAGLIGYGAMASLALAAKKHRPTPPLPYMPSPSTARIVGWLLVALSAMAAMLRYGPALGIVAWVGQICVAGALFVLLMSWHARHAFLLGMAGLVAAPFIMMI